MIKSIHFICYNPKYSMNGFRYGVSNYRGLIALVRIIATTVELLIVLRVLLIFFSASTSAPFVQWINELTNPLLSPFVNMFPSVNVGDDFVIEFYALFAIIVYAFVGYLVTEVLRIYANHRANRESKKE